MAQIDHKFKVILLGNIDVGKTSLIVRFTEDTFSETAKEIDQKSRDIKHNGAVAKIILTDTAGQERFRTLTSSYYRNADAIVVVYDVTDSESFEDVEGHITEGSRYSQRSQKFLVGNKMDLQDQRAVPTNDGKMLASRFGVDFFETSALSGQNVDELFQYITQSLIENGANGPSKKAQKGVVPLDQAKPAARTKGCEV